MTGPTLLFSMIVMLITFSTSKIAKVTIEITIDTKTLKKSLDRFCSLNVCSCTSHWLLILKILGVLLIIFSLKFFLNSRSFQVFEVLVCSRFGGSESLTADFSDMKLKQLEWILPMPVPLDTPPAKSELVW